MNKVPCREDRHDALRDDALREPGADADGAEARPRGRGRGDLPEVGARLRGDRRSDRHRPHGTGVRTARSSATSRSARWPTKRRSTTGRTELRDVQGLGQSSRSATFPKAPTSPRDLLKLMASPDLASRRWIWEQYDQPGRRRHRPAPGRRRGGGPRPRHEEGAGDHHRLHAALLLRRPGRGREAGGRRGLSQPLRGRREAARDHQLPQLRQPAAARDHGPVRRLPRGHGRGLPRARLPDRERQRQPLQREQSHGRRQRILPTPAIGGVGLLDDWEKSATIAFKAEGEHACVLHRAQRRPCRASPYGSTICMAGATARRRRSTSPPNGALGECIRKLIADGLVTAVHDCLGRRRSWSRSRRWRWPAISA